jgi:hypothetical protein
MSNISYHGTNKKHAEKIIGPPSQLDIGLGKGELGKGFYCGNSIALAAIWAQLRHLTEAVVIEFDIPKQNFVQLKGYIIKSQAVVIENWHFLMSRGETSTHLFGYDYIIAPFATIEHIGNQIKFESEKAELELRNSEKNIFPCVS